MYYWLHSKTIDLDNEEYVITDKVFDTYESAVHYAKHKWPDVEMRYMDEREDDIDVPNIKLHLEDYEGQEIMIVQVFSPETTKLMYGNYHGLNKLFVYDRYSNVIVVHKFKVRDDEEIVIRSKEFPFSYGGL